MKPISVLIVDETSVFLELLAQLFSGLEPPRNAAVETLGDFEKSVPRAQAMLPDVIVDDLGLPGLCGLPSIRRLRLAFPNVRIIALTAMDSPLYRSEAIRAGADEVIYKGMRSGIWCPRSIEFFKLGPRRALWEAFFRRSYGAFVNQGQLPDAHVALDA